MEVRRPCDYKYILFDLDGTLTDSFPGISRCVQYALAKFGLLEADQSMLLKFCGPPLMDSFQNLYGFSYEDAARATAYYREEYMDKGILENDVYEGIPELLAALKASGRKILLATSKPESMAYTVLNHFRLTDYFDTITGASLRDDVRHSKADVIRETMARQGISAEEQDQVLMVGDRKYDVAGALACGLDCLGVYYGYAEPGELETAGAVYTVQTVAELKCALLGEDA